MWTCQELKNVSIHSLNTLLLRKYKIVTGNKKELEQKDLKMMELFQNSFIQYKIILNEITNSFKYFCNVTIL